MQEFDPQNPFRAPQSGSGYASFVQPTSLGHSNRLADPGTRLVAQIVDLLAFFASGLPGLGVVAMFPDDGAPPSPLVLIPALFLACIPFVFIVYQIVQLSTRGQTIGKKTMRVRIVRYDDGGNPGFVGAFLLRTFVPNLIGVVPCLGGIFFLVDVFCIFGNERRCLHDQIAGTKVVQV